MEVDGLMDGLMLYSESLDMVTFIKKYTPDVDSFISDSEYIKDCHTVIFSISFNDTVLIKEMFIRLTTVKNKERSVSMGEAIEFQKKLRKFGYDKIS